MQSQERGVTREWYLPWKMAQRDAINIRVFSMPLIRKSVSVAITICELMNCHLNNLGVSGSRDTGMRE